LPPSWHLATAADGKSSPCPPDLARWREAALASRDSLAIDDDCAVACDCVHLRQLLLHCCYCSGRCCYRCYCWRPRILRLPQTHACVAVDDDDNDDGLYPDLDVRVNVSFASFRTFSSYDDDDDGGDDDGDPCSSISLAFVNFL